MLIVAHVASSIRGRLKTLTLETHHAWSRGWRVLCCDLREEIFGTSLLIFGTDWYTKWCESLGQVERGFRSLLVSDDEVVMMADVYIVFISVE